MCRFALISCLSLFASAASAQTVDRPRFDVNFSAGFFEARPEEDESTNTYQHWYGEGRYALGLGYYWTDNFKTEIEFAHTPEGSRYVQDFVTIPGSGGQVFPYSFESYHRIQQTSVRAVWQFLDNVWVHPYLNGGFVYEAERNRYLVPEQYRYLPPPDPRGTPPPPELLRPAFRSGDVMEHRGGVTIGGGAKFYMSPAAYINTGMQVTYARPSTTVSFLAGFGIDF
jgi:hypothetical protein